jgi:hypothetical protein
VSEKEQSAREIGSKINFKIIAVIIILAFGYHLYISMIEQDPEVLEFSDISYAIGALACGVMSIIISRRYKGSEIFSKTYLALGIGFMFLFLGDIVYNYYDLVLQEIPYPSLADVFYLAFPPLVTYHLVVNIRYFMKEMDVSTVVGQVTFPISIVFVYAFLSFDEMAGFNFEYYISLFYVLSSSVILSLSMLALSIFKKSVLGVAWLLLAMGIFANMIADDWYYYVELLDVFDTNHPVNTVWVLGFMIIFYALYKHRQII